MVWDSGDRAAADKIVDGLHSGSNSEEATREFQKQLSARRDNPNEQQIFYERVRAAQLREEAKRISESVGNGKPLKYGRELARLELSEKTAPDDARVKEIKVSEKGERNSAKAYVLARISQDQERGCHHQRRQQSQEYGSSPQEYEPQRARDYYPPQAQDYVSQPVREYYPPQAQEYYPQQTREYYPPQGQQYMPQQPNYWQQPYEYGNSNFFRPFAYQMAPFLGRLLGGLLEQQIYGSHYHNHNYNRHYSGPRYWGY